MAVDQGIKYLAALPLFNPTILSGRIPAQEARVRLMNNVRASVRRIINYAVDKLELTVRSIAFASLGGTSHSGGDSPYFLEFDESFFSILESLEQSRPPGSLDRVYLIAYERHKDVFRREALEALQRVSALLILKRYCQPGQAAIIWGAIAIAFVCLSLLSYHNVGRIVVRNNRWGLIDRILAVALIGPSLCWGFFVSLISSGSSPGTALCLYCLSSIALIVGVLWLSKRLPKRN